MLEHPCLFKLYRGFEDKHTCIILFEYEITISLNNFINLNLLSNDDSITGIIHQILCIVNYMHSIG